MYVRTIEQGNVVRWYGINAGIDDRKRAEQKLQGDKRDLRAITDAIRQPIVAIERLLPSDSLSRLRPDRFEMQVHPLLVRFRCQHVLLRIRHFGERAA